MYTHVMCVQMTCVYVYIHVMCVACTRVELCCSLHSVCMGQD